METIKKLAQQDVEYIRNIRHTIHANPELSFKEFATTKLIAEELTKCGIEVKTWEGQTGVLGTLVGAKPGKVIALRADIDALPLVEKSGLDFHSNNEGVCHACGHDMHTSVLLGAARVLGQMREQLAGTVKFVFQPAEETLGGSSTMIERGVLENPKVDAMFALHTWPDLPEGTIGYKAGSFMASADSVDVKITGRAGHAAHPHRSIDPVVATAAVIQGVQTFISREIAPTDSAVITFGKIQGGTVRNIIAGDVTLEGTIRCASKVVRDNMPEMLKRMVESTAAAYRCTAEVDYHAGNPPVVNDDELTDFVAETGRKILGADKVQALKAMSMGSEDFAWYMEQVPGCVYRLGTHTEEAQSHLALHNPEIRFGEKALLTGVEVMSALAVNYLK